MRRRPARPGSQAELAFLGGTWETQGQPGRTRLAGGSLGAVAPLGLGSPGDPAARSTCPSLTQLALPCRPPSSIYPGFQRPPSQAEVVRNFPPSAPPHPARSSHQRYQVPMGVFVSGPAIDAVGSRRPSCQVCCCSSLQAGHHLQFYTAPLGTSRQLIRTREALFRPTTSVSSWAGTNDPCSGVHMPPRPIPAPARPPGTPGQARARAEDNAVALMQQAADPR